MRQENPIKEGNKMRVNMIGWLNPGDPKLMDGFAVEVTEIPCENDRFIVTAGVGDSHLAAEILAEVLQHYLDTFPGAGDRLCQAATGDRHAGTRLTRKGAPQVEIEPRRIQNPPFSEGNFEVKEEGPWQRKKLSVSTRGFPQRTDRTPRPRKTS